MLALEFIALGLMLASHVALEGPMACSWEHKAIHPDVGLDFNMEQALGSGFDYHSAEDKMGLLPWWEEGGGLRRKSPLILHHQ